MENIVRIRRRVIEVLDGLRDHDPLSRLVNTGIMALILANIAALILETVPAIAAAHQGFFNTFETVSIGVFSVEYLLRMWSCTAIPAYADALRGRVRYGLRPYPLIDLFTVLPYYIPFILPLDLRMIRLLRFFRVVRIFKLDRHAHSLELILRVFRACRTEMVTVSGTMFIVILLSSFAMYLVEHTAQPHVFSSIPMTIWWAVATLTTIGYGDMYPITLAGRVLGSIIAILGIGMFALPTSILGAGFMEELERTRGTKTVRCPHCGREFSNAG